MNTPTRNFALIECKRNYALLRSYIVSLLAAPGSLIVHEDEVLSDDLWWVLSSDERGAVAWSCQCDMRNGKYKAVLSRNREGCWRQICIHDHREWYAYGVCGVSPLELDPTSITFTEMVIKPDAAPTGLLEFAARRGFNHLTKEQMLSLIRHLGLKGANKLPTIVYEVARFFVERAWPSATPEEIEAALAHRNQRSQNAKASVVQMNPELTTGILEADEQRALEIERVRKKELETEAPVAAKYIKHPAVKIHDPSVTPPTAETEPEPLPKLPASPEAPGAAASSTDAIAPTKALPRVDDDGFLDGNEVRAFLPKRAGISMSMKDGRCWIVKYTEKPVPPRSHTETWGGVKGQSHRDAALGCLRWAWQVYTDAGHEDCPYDLT